MVLFGEPLFVGLILLFHPSHGLPEPGKPFDFFGFVAPVADRFVLVHLLFGPALAVLGLAMYFLLNGFHGRAATISRVVTPIAIVAYIMYESIVGSATGNLVRTSLSLPAAQQAVIAQAASKLWADPILGDFPALVPIIAGVGWMLAVIAAAFALRRAGVPISVCLLFVLSIGLTVHSLPSGPIAMLSFFLVAVWVERAGEKITKAEKVRTPAQAVV
jgi:hypothetical protein